MSWLALTICCDADKTVELSDRLADAGAVSVSLSDASGQALVEGDLAAGPLWPRTRVRALFRAEARLDGLIAWLTEAGYPTPSIASVDDRDWENAWRQEVRARRYGGRLWVLPSFTEASPDQETCVRLDPGLAFGTGAHPTTAMCLEWLDRMVPAGASVIDFGCGSGILAIAAVKLGAGSVRAVDTDPQALDTALENARDNGCAREISFFRPQALPRDPADVLVANIFAGALIELGGQFAELVRIGGRVALSGILTSQIGPVSEAYRDAFDLEAPRVREGWILLSGRRKCAPA